MNLLKRLKHIMFPPKETKQEITVTEVQQKIAEGLHDYHERFFADLPPEMKADFYRWKRGMK